jgi:hypothetical protein
MNDSDDLMIHVERIVRPVRGFAGRKLRMRQELLAHLQAAVAEEREARTTDATALARAKARLGDPAELTLSLQASVPRAERVLAARLPLPRALARLEARGGRWWGLDWTMTLPQASVVVAGAVVLPWAALVGLAIELHLGGVAAVNAMMDRPGETALMNVWNIALLAALTMLCARWVIAVANGRWMTRTAARYATAITVAPLLSMLFMIHCVHARGPTAAEVAWSLGAGVAMTGVQALAARLVARMRRPYVQWLALDVAG